MKFKVGDKVEYKGEDTTVAAIPHASANYIIEYKYGWKRDRDIPADYKFRKWDQYYFATEESLTRLVEESSKTEINNNKTIMTSLKAIWKSINQSEPEKTFIKAGIMDESEELTTDGKDLFIKFLFDKNVADFKKEVVDPIVAEQEKADK